MVKKLYPHYHYRPGPQVLVELGSSKILVLYVDFRYGKDPYVQEWLIQESRGIRRGAIVDLEALAAVLREMLSTLEKRFNTVIEHMIVAWSGVDLRARHIKLRHSVPSHRSIHADDVRRLLDQCAPIVEDQAKEWLLHRIPLGFGVADQSWVDDPVGRVGSPLVAHVHCISLGAEVAASLFQLGVLCKVPVAAVVSSSYVASFAVLTEEERQLGGTLVDMGSQNTTIASWQHGVCTHVGGFQLGSSHITSDIAYGLGVSLQDAEHVKTLYGHATVIAQDASVVLDLPCMSHHVETYGPLTRAALGEIIFARIEEWCAWLDREMDSMQLDPMARSKIILTGGGSQLLGLADAIGSLLKGGPMVRLGLPSYDHLVFHETMASMSLQRPHYAVALGFLKFALGRLQESRYHGEHPLGPMDRCWRWLRQWKERLVPC